MITTEQVNGYYAIYLDDAARTIQHVGYTSGEVSTINKIVVADPVLSLLFESEFSSFLTVMYRTGLDIFGTKSNLNLTEKMRRAGVLDDFASIKVLDVMALLEAVQYDVSQHIKLPTMTQEELDAIPERPSVASVLATSAGDDTLLIQAIKSLGLDGWLPYIYAERGISFDKFCELWFYFYPTIEQRRRKFFETTPFLRAAGRAFGPEHVEALIENTDHAENKASIVEEEYSPPLPVNPDPVTLEPIQ